VVYRRAGSSVIDCAWNKRVSKNHIGSVKVSRITYTLLFDPQSTTPKVDTQSTTLKAILPTVTPPMWLFDTFLFDPRCTTLKVGRIALSVVDCVSTLGVVDCGSNKRVSKNRIGGVKVSRIALSVVDRTPPMCFFDTLLFDQRSTTIDSANLYTTYVILWYFSVWPTTYHTRSC
jgi:hypothetical protein